jgi:hemolysin III
MLRNDIKPMAPAEQVTLAKPLLRGWPHAGAALVMAIVTLFFCLRSWGKPVPFVTLGIYGMTATEMYTVSALFHLGRWRAARWRQLRTLDHASIFIAIAGTYTPFCLLAAGGQMRLALLGLVWAFALVGIALKIWLPYMSRAFSTSLYVALGWLAALGLPTLKAMLPWQGIALLLAGGLCYMLGAVVYGWRFPDPYPRIFGYHEIFHLLVVAGNAAFVVVLLLWVMPGA